MPFLSLADMVSKREFHVIRDVQIQVAVGVDIQETGSRPHLTLARHPAWCVTSVERPITVVAVQDIGAEIVDEQIGVPSLSKSPTVTPSPNPVSPTPAWSVTSRNRQPPSLRYNALRGGESAVAPGNGAPLTR
jgi:hypothetical protein